MGDGEPVTIKVTGVYRWHWELPYFTPHCRPTWLSVVANVILRGDWDVAFPKEFKLPWSEQLGGQPTEVFSAPRYFAMTLEGTLSEKGRFGHRGCLRRKLVVQKIHNARQIRLGVLWASRCQQADATDGS